MGTPAPLELQAETGATFLCIHPELFSGTLRFSSVILTDQLKEYLLDEVEYWTPAILPRVRHMRRKGSPAVSFNPKTLRNAIELVQLELWILSTFMDSMEPCPFIPPVEDFETTTNCGEVDDSDYNSGNVDYCDNLEGGSNYRTGTICTSTQPSALLSPKQRRPV